MLLSSLLLMMSMCFSGWWFGNEVVSSSSFSLSLPTGTDCKENLSLVNYFSCLFLVWPYSSLSCFQEEPSPTPGAPEVSGPVDKKNETEERVHSCGERQVFSPEENRAIGGAIERLGLQLLEKLPIGPQQPNVVLSPLSLAFALAHLTLG